VKKTGQLGKEERGKGGVGVNLAVYCFRTLRLSRNIALCHRRKGGERKKGEERGGKGGKTAKEKRKKRHEKNGKHPVRIIYFSRCGFISMVSSAMKRGKEKTKTKGRERKRKKDDRVIIRLYLRVKGEGGKSQKKKGRGEIV